MLPLNKENTDSMPSARATVQQPKVTTAAAVHHVAPHLVRLVTPPEVPRSRSRTPEATVSRTPVSRSQPRPLPAEELQSSLSSSQHAPLFMPRLPSVEELDTTVDDAAAPVYSQGVELDDIALADEDASLTLGDTARLLSSEGAGPTLAAARAPPRINVSVLARTTVSMPLTDELRQTLHEYLEERRKVADLSGRSSLTWSRGSVGGVGGVGGTGALPLPHTRHTFVGGRASSFRSSFRQLLSAQHPRYDAPDLADEMPCAVGSRPHHLCMPGLPGLPAHTALQLCAP